jgi:hypothetical protein
MNNYARKRVGYAEINSDDEEAFYEALRHEGMEEGSYAIAAAMRGFRRWREEHPRT